jgi:hypothetical protein
MKTIVLVLVLALAGCARGEAVRTSANTMMVQTSAAPVCGGGGALQVAQRVAAIETIRAGYDRYIITGGQSQNNFRGAHDQGLAVAMFREGEPGGQQAVSARAELGPNWEEQVKNGIRTCL